MDQVCQVPHDHHYVLTTEKTYSQWIIYYNINFGLKRYPREINLKQIESWLNYY
jgi:hypothetical protein